MKITHVIESTGGSADFVLYLAKYIPEYQHDIIYGDRTFSAFGGRFENLKSEYSNTNFIYWKHVQREIDFKKDFLAAIELFRILRKTKSDVIHLHSSKAGFLGRLICFILKRKRVIYTPNGLPFLRNDVSDFTRKLYIFLERIANKLCGQVIACSKSESIAMIELGISSKYINNGTEILPYSAKSYNDQIIIATTGRITIQKNPALFNKIASYFENRFDVKFLWIGDGELREQLTSSNIEITGWMTRRDVLKHLVRIDIYLSTALWEGLPFAVLEAMNYGKPLILSKCVGNVDLVNNNGYTFESLEQVIELLNKLISDRELLVALGKKSHELINEEFNVLKMAKKYKSAYSHNVAS